MPDDDAVPPPDETNDDGQQGDEVQDFGNPLSTFTSDELIEELVNRSDAMAMVLEDGKGFRYRLYPNPIAVAGLMAYLNVVTRKNLRDMASE